MNPYDVLGVPKTASSDQIKGAYRRLARKTHPDNGGTGDDFSTANRAYSILMDPEMRKRFDETGSIEDVAPLTIRQRMIQIIADMFNQALAVEGKAGTSLRHFPLVKAMREQIGRNTKLLRDNYTAHKKMIDDRRFLLTRISRNDDGQNLFADIIRNQIKELEPVVRQADVDVRAMEMATEELMHYENEVDLIQAVQMMQFGGNFAGQNATGGGLWATNSRLGG